MILYIHGFKSCGKGNKSDALRRYFGEKKILAPNLPVSPKEAIDFLSYMINQNDIELIVGSSLGGFYTIYLAEKFDKKAVLINPSLKPYITLYPYIGENSRFCDGMEFFWKEEYIKELINLKVDKVTLSRYLVLLQSKDEVLNYQETLNFFIGAKVVVEYGGNHRFENIGDYLCMIDRFRY